MLSRMLIKACAKEKAECEVEEEMPTPAGFKSVALRVEGKMGERIARHEAGAHRLIRSSPFGDGRVQTSFAAVSAQPLGERAAEGLDLSEVKFWATTSQGPGGQHVNKTQSAIWAKHLPTGVAVCAQSRSQTHSKELAIARLGQKLAEMRESERRAGERQAWAERPDASFGQAHRTYRMQGDLARDERTGRQMSAKEALDGKVAKLWR
jgi:protein subunit release factor B